MTYEEKLIEKQNAVNAAEAEVTAAEKRLLDCEKRYTRNKASFFVKAVVLLLLLAVAAATFMLARSDKAVGYLTEKLIAATTGTEEELGFWLTTIKDTLTEMPTAMEQLIIMAGATVISILLATIGAGGTGLGWGLISALIGMGGMVYFFKGIHFIGYLPIPVCIFAVVVKINSARYSWGQSKANAENAAAACKKAREALEAEKAALTTLEADHRKAVQLYNDAVADNNNEELMRGSAALGCEEAIVYISKLDAERAAEEAERLYKQATEGEEPDEALMEKAAELGHPTANLYMGKKLCGEASTGVYTGREKENMLADAVDYLDVAMEKGDEKTATEAELWSISCRTMYESGTAAQWREKLERLRALKKKGIPEECNEVYNTLAQSIVEVIDSLDSKGASTPTGEPRLKRKYCAYNNSGVCTFYSTASYLARCDYLSNPGDCSAALNQKALRFEFE